MTEEKKAPAKIDQFTPLPEGMVAMTLPTGEGREFVEDTPESIHKAKRERGLVLASPSKHAAKVVVMRGPSNETLAVQSDNKSEMARLTRMGFTVDPNYAEKSAPKPKGKE